MRNERVIAMWGKCDSLDSLVTRWAVNFHACAMNELSQCGGNAGGKCDSLDPLVTRWAVNFHACAMNELSLCEGKCHKVVGRKLSNVAYSHGFNYNMYVLPSLN